MPARGAPWSRKTAGRWAAGVVVVAVALSLGLVLDGSGQRSVPAAQPAAYRTGRTLIEDHFSRSSASTWPAAVVGGPYALAPRDGFEVSDGTGRMEHPVSAIARSATVESTRPVDVQASVVVAVPALPTRGVGVYAALYLRSNGQTAYRADLRFTPDRRVHLTVSRFDQGPAVSQVLAPSRVVGSDVKQGERLTLTFRVVGSSPVRLAAAVQREASTELRWQQVLEDASSSRLVAGGAVSLWSYVARSSDPRRAVLFDDLVVSELVPDPAADASTEPRLSPPDSADDRAAGPTATSVARQRTKSSAGSVAVGRARYDIPWDAVFVSPTGTDQGSGSLRFPWRTLEQAVSRARPGAVIVLREGSYHESVVLPSGKQLTVQAYPGEEVWLDGTSRVPKATRRAGHWVVPGWDHVFDSSPTHTKGAADGTEDGWRFLDPEHPLAAHPDQVWRDGEPLRQVAASADITRGTFAVDPRRRELLLGDDPRGHEVRASTLQSALRIEGPGDVVRGLGVRGYATSVWQGGALVVRAADAELENLVVEDNATTGVSVGATGASLRKVSASGNGMLGVAAHHADGLRLVQVLAERNNREQFNLSPVAGGAKITSSRRVRVRGSEFSHNVGHGLWVDASSHDVVVVGSAARGNVGSGVRVEISDEALLVHNVVTGNGKEGIRVVNSEHVEIAGNTLARNYGRNLALTADARRASSRTTPGHDSRRRDDPSMTWKTASVDVYDNVLSDGGGSCVVCVTGDPDRLDPSTITFDHNFYQRTSPVSPGTFAAWPAASGAEPRRFRDLRSATAATGQDRQSYLSPSSRSVVDRSGEVTRAVRDRAAEVARPLSRAAADEVDEADREPHLGAG